MVAHRIAVVLLVVGAGVWGGVWSVVRGDAGGLAPRFVAEPPAATGVAVEWGPRMVTAAAQMEEAAGRAARLVVSAGAGVLGVSLISALLLFSASRTAGRPAHRIHRAVGASLRRLRRDATTDAFGALGIAALGAATVGACVANAGAWYWSRAIGVGGEHLGTVVPTLAALVVTLPAISLPLVALFRASVPVSPLPRTRSARYVPDPFSGLAIAQVAVAAAALALVAMIPTVQPTASVEHEGRWVELRASSPLDSQAVRSALSTVEGVGSIALASPGMWAGLGTQDFLLSECGNCFIGGLPTPWKGETAVHAWIGEGALDSLKLTVTAGRGFSAAEFAAPARVAVVSRHFANQHFEAGQAVGRRVRVGKDPDAWYEVVGVVADGPHPLAFGASAQVDSWVLLPLAPGMLHAVTARIAGVPSAAEVENALAAAAPGATITSLPYAEYTAHLAGPANWLRAWIVFLGVTALGISLIGVFTATLAQVQQRRVELSIRRSVGASRLDVLRRVLGQATRIALIGIPVGFWISTFGLGALRQTSGATLPSGPWGFALVMAIALCCLAGGVAPAVRAAWLPPAEALRRAE